MFSTYLVVLGPLPPAVVQLDDSVPCADAEDGEEGQVHDAV